MGIEIERRFLVDGRGAKPWQNCEGVVSMYQCYLAGVIHADGVISYSGTTLVNEENSIENIATWRIRKQGDDCVLTAKGRRIGASAIEHEWPISTEIFDSITNEGNLPSTRKSRYLWRGGDGLLWEIDEFEGALAGLIIAEVELDDENQAVIIPEWVGMELTNLKGWSNASLANMIEDAKRF
jgi:CYTH domain-containing protein